MTSNSNSPNPSKSSTDDRDFAWPAIVNQTWFCWAMFLFATLGIAFAAARAYREYHQVADQAPISPEMDFTRPGMFDFHMGGYLPAKLFLARVNPYSPEVLQQYPMQRPAPTYSPVVFILHLPFAPLTLPAADVVYFAFNVTLLGGLAYLALAFSKARFQLAVWLGIVGLFAFSRAGHITLVSGYFTLQLVLGTMLALHYGRTKPLLAACGMLLASGKPTYIIPLTIVMLAKRNFAAVLIGFVVCAIVAGAGIGWLASESSLSSVVEGIRAGEELFHADDNETPENTWTRVDLIGMIAKVIHWKPDNTVYLTAMVVLLLGPCFILWRLAATGHDCGVTGLSGMISSLAILLAIYHHSYDCLLVAIPWVAVTFFADRMVPELTHWQQRFVSLLLAVPAINYAATYKVRGLLNLDDQPIIWNVVTSLNGICLLAALMILLWVAISLLANQSQVAIQAQRAGE